MSVHSLNTYTIILLYGSLIFLSIILISNPMRVNRKANFWFGCSTLIWSTYWLDEILTVAAIQISPGTELLIKFIQIFTPIIFLFSIVFFTNPDYKFSFKNVVYLIIPALYLLGLMAKQGEWIDYPIDRFLIYIVLFQAIILSIYSYVKIKKHKEEIHLFSSNTTEIDLRWLEFIIISLIALSAFIVFYNLIFPTQDLSLLANLFTLFIVFFVAYNVLKQKEIFFLDEQERILIIQDARKTDLSQRKLISDEELKLFKDKLDNLMAKERPYLDPDLNLNALADLLDTTPHQLSYIINRGFNENFFTFINRYRINTVKDFLINRQKDHLSIMGIAYESGFNSKTSFYNTFKKFTGYTPSEFKKKGTHL